MKRKNWKQQGNDIVLFCFILQLFSSSCSFKVSKSIERTEYKVTQIDTLGAYLAITLIGHNNREYEIIAPQAEMQSEGLEANIKEGKIIKLCIKKYNRKMSPVSKIAEKLGLYGREFINNGRKYSPGKVYYYICW